MIETNLNALAAEVHKNAVEHGWWETPPTVPEILMLCVSELSEALEEYRDGKPPLYTRTAPAHNVCVFCQSETCDCEDLRGTPECEHSKPEGVAIELADCIIRILDYCAFAEIDIEAAICMKHNYNETRPYRHGGKQI